MSAPLDTTGADHYQTLGISSTASEKDIKKAFRQIAKECHPDVAGDDPVLAARFKKALLAYEVLSDPKARARYDRRNEPNQRRPLFDFWQTRSAPDPEPSPRYRSQDPSNDLDLEDIFNDFSGRGAFGFGNGTSGGPSSQTAEAANRSSRPGPDIQVKVEVSTGMVEKGGLVTLEYPRLLRGETGLELHPYEELYELRVPPGVRHGDTLRVPHMGSAGANGGPYGDLVCDVIILPEARSDGSRATDDGTARGAGSARADEGASPDGTAAGPLTLPISVTEALLGGRAELCTPQGIVRVVIPPCTSSGARLRLKGKGPREQDLYVVIRIVLPSSLDEPSRRIVEEFARLNPYDPRG